MHTIIMPNYLCIIDCLLRNYTSVLDHSYPSALVVNKGALFLGKFKVTVMLSTPGECPIPRLVLQHSHPLSFWDLLISLWLQQLVLPLLLSLCWADFAPHKKHCAYLSPGLRSAQPKPWPLLTSWYALLSPTDHQAPYLGVTSITIPFNAPKQQAKKRVFSPLRPYLLLQARPFHVLNWFPSFL